LLHPIQFHMVWCLNIEETRRFEFLAVVNIKKTVLCYMQPSSVVERQQYPSGGSSHWTIQHCGPQNCNSWRILLYCCTIVRPALSLWDFTSICACPLCRHFFLTKVRHAVWLCMTLSIHY
jgi:hypothetical protein